MRLKERSDLKLNTHQEFRSVAVLLVENNLLVASLTESLLEELGHSVVAHCVSGEEAISWLENRDAELILMDIGLDGALDGIETAAKILQVKSIPIIFCTAHSDLPTLVRAQKTVPYGYLVKPFELHSLRASVEMALFKFENEQKLKKADLALAESNKALEKANHDLRELLQWVEHIQEQERRSIASEIHDMFGQELMGLKMNNAYIRKNSKSLPEKLKEALAQSDEALARMTDQVHRLAHDLRPVMLENLGLLATIQHDLDNLASLGHYSVSFSGPSTPLALDKYSALSLYRVFQEVITNIEKHAQATKIDVVFSTNESGWYSCTITDNGVGFVVEPSKSDRHGQLSIRERMLALKGTYELQSQPGKGTFIHLLWPPLF